MPEEEKSIDEAAQLIRKTNEEAEALKARLEAGEEIDEKELIALARQMATQIEMARAMLESMVGPIDPQQMHAKMEADLSPQEYQNWVATEKDRAAFREEVKRERTVADQLDKEADAGG
jgi:hypothetical protein